MKCPQQMSGEWGLRWGDFRGRGGLWDFFFGRKSVNFGPDTVKSGCLEGGCLVFYSTSFYLEFFSWKRAGVQPAPLQPDGWTPLWGPVVPLGSRKLTHISHTFLFKCAGQFLKAGGMPRTSSCRSCSQILPVLLIYYFGLICLIISIYVIFLWLLWCFSYCICYYYVIYLNYFFYFCGYSYFLLTFLLYSSYFTSFFIGNMLHQPLWSSSTLPWICQHEKA